MIIQHQLDIRKSNKTTTKTTQKPAYWIDSMEPIIHYPGPGKSRMGMELIPVYANQTQDNSTVKISPAVINNLGIRTIPVMQSALPRQIETVGYVEPNENAISHIHMYTDGWIKKLLVKANEEPVKKGQLLFQLYSPTLVNAQEEYLLALDSRNADLIAASYAKLKALNVADSQIQNLQKTRKVSQLVNIYAPQDGVVTKLNVREGMRVTPEIEIMEITDLSTIWLIANIIETQAGWVKVGQPATATLTAYPNKVWQGTVDYVYPEMDTTTRTLKIRLQFANPTLLLKPGMYATVTLFAGIKENVLSIPKEALIRSSHGDYVVVSLGDGRFQVRAITVGMESNDRAEILSGLTSGESVVISGQFLIDSEANLKASMQRMSP
ncbi:MAG: efflux RND transporter periplasmic adaptor subunit [Coxiellaceae bacterium]|nr:MAG: efflux RND transporter periplasmic adaptor subunit [Coxiellaceae bacterium]